MRINEDDLRALGEFQFRFSRLESYVAFEGFCSSSGFVKDEHWENFFRTRLKPEMYVIKRLEQVHELKKPIQYYHKSGSSWQWSVDKNMESTDSPGLLKRLVRVRHNLFHGNKDLPTVARDRALIQEGLIILRDLAQDLYDYGKLL